MKNFCVVDPNVEVSDLKIEDWRSYIHKSVHRLLMNQHYKESLFKSEKLEE